MAERMRTACPAMIFRGGIFFHRGLCPLCGGGFLRFALKTLLFTPTEEQRQMPSGLPLCFLLPGKILSWQNPFQLVLGILPLQGFDGFGTGFPVTAGNEKFCGNPLLGKHPLMFSGKALGKAAVRCRQIYIASIIIIIYERNQTNYITCSIYY